MRTMIHEVCLILWISMIVSSIGGCHRDNQLGMADTGEKEEIAKSEVRNGDTTKNEDATKSEITDTAKNEAAITSEIADIAKKEAQRRGWTGQFTIDVSKTKEGWGVLVSGVPATPGGFAIITIASDKKVTGYLPGK